jgi:hypothetical protein
MTLASGHFAHSGANGFVASLVRETVRKAIVDQPEAGDGIGGSALITQQAGETPRSAQLRAPSVSRQSTQIATFLIKSSNFCSVGEWEVGRLRT